MDHDLAAAVGDLTTAHLADACVRTRIEVRCGPAGLRPVEPGSRVAGRVLPARHAGSVDVFLEAIERSRPGDVLVVDNGGRLDHACVGDLVVQEAASAGLRGLVIWGLHRDTADIRAIGLPVFSLGAIATGPLRPEQRASDALDAATVGEWAVGTVDVVVADDDGALFLPADRLADVLPVAAGIRDTERRQAGRVRGGDSLRAQVRFGAFLGARQQDPTLTFRDHLRAVGGAIEE